MKEKFTKITKVASFRDLGLLLLICGMSSACQPGNEETLFILQPAHSSGVDFQNTLRYDEEFNIYTYRNFYNGGGVAIGDINNDGLPDLYFTANQGPNRLYLNRGDFRFEDITERAGVAGKRKWSTGVSMADVNGDGWLDIYVCNSGDVRGDDKQNELFINRGDLTFSEAGEAYQVDDGGYSTHGVFFDYDNDGDLDLYVLNNSYLSVGNFNLRKNERPKTDSLGGDKLLRNDGGKFTDVTTSAGIFGSLIGFGLGVAVGDVNKDGWLDIYVCNDFFERDYFYINQRNGTFKEQLDRSFNSISAASMGADMADINNDTWPDIFVTDMLPATNERVKSVTTFQNWDTYRYHAENDYHHQFTRNTFQLNDGDTTFSEIGRLLGIQATDWSWGALMFDMDNDGQRDIFVANGIFKDLTDQDYLQHMSNADILQAALASGKPDYQKMIDAIPSNQIPNAAFQNTGALAFVNQTERWGLSTPGFSNGSAYGDLDNDGDLDLVINNVNMPAFIYRNQSRERNLGHFLKFVLVGEQGNTAALGASITIETPAGNLYAEQMPMRGFQSSVDPRPNLGLGAVDTVPSVTVRWPSGKVTVLRDVAADQVLTLRESDGVAPAPADLPVRSEPMLQDITSQTGIDYRHRENVFSDFDSDRLLFHMLSAEGPRLCVADVDGDGSDDFYVGGGRGQPGALYRQLPNGKFEASSAPTWETDRRFEDTACAFFDADGDGDADLYVGSGGSDAGSDTTLLTDRLYINDGKGGFHRADLPSGMKGFVTSCVVAADFDGDGDEDLFVGARFTPHRYGLPSRSLLLSNDGTGHFSDATAEIAPSLLSTGHVTDACWADVDGDGADDLVVAGEWMPLTVMLQRNGKLVDATADAGLGKLTGWWNRVIAVDVDGDGDQDLVAGNHGLNSRFKASADRPLEMYTTDVDGNGSVEQIMCMYYGDHSYPLPLRHDLVTQVPALGKKYVRHDQYKNEAIADVLDKNQLAQATRMEAREMRTMVLLNDKKGVFGAAALPIEAQFAPVYGVIADDANGDGITDLLLGGNLYRVKPEAGRYDAGHGLLLAGDGTGQFSSVGQQASGVNIDGEVRDIQVIVIAGRRCYLVARNDDSLRVWTTHK